MYMTSRLTKYKWFSKMKEELHEIAGPIEPLIRLDFTRSVEAATCMSLNLREIYG